MKYGVQKGQELGDQLQGLRRRKGSGWGEQHIHVRLAPDVTECPDSPGSLISSQSTRHSKGAGEGRCKEGGNRERRREREGEGGDSRAEGEEGGSGRDPPESRPRGTQQAAHTLTGG